MLIKLFVIYIIGSQLDGSQGRTPHAGQNVCHIRGGRTGKCIQLGDCPELLNYREKYGRTDKRTKALFISRVCRTVGQVAYVCCRQRRILPVTTSPVPLVPVHPTSSDILPTIDQCGYTSITKIFNGNETVLGSHPWLVAIGYVRGREANFNHLCGGTLITRRHILTAAHCFKRRPGVSIPTHVVLGDHDLSQDLLREQRTMFKIASRVNPEFDIESLANDIELLTLEHDVQFTYAIRPACLPFNFRKTNFDGKKMTVIGWGITKPRIEIKSDIPLAATITITNEADCKKAFLNHPEVRLQKYNICAGGKSNKDACLGDSGGPLIFVDDHDTRLNYVMGIVSAGAVCGSVQYPGIYVFVPDFLDWIVGKLS